MQLHRLGNASCSYLALLLCPTILHSSARHRSLSGLCWIPLRWRLGGTTTTSLGRRCTCLAALASSVWALPQVHLPRVLAKIVVPVQSTRVQRTRVRCKGCRVPQSRE